MITLKNLENNNFFVRLNRENEEYLIFKVYSEDDLNNVVNLQWDKVDFNYYKYNKIYEYGRKRGTSLQRI